MDGKQIAKAHRLLKNKKFIRESHQFWKPLLHEDVPLTAEAAALIENKRQHYASWLAKSAMHMTFEDYLLLSDALNAAAEGA